MQKYLREINLDKMHLAETPIYEHLKQIKYDYFHTNPEDYSDIQCTKNILNEDNSLIEIVNKTRKKFPENSNFLRGCIRIAKK